MYRTQLCYSISIISLANSSVQRASPIFSPVSSTVMDCLKYANRNKGLLVVTPTKVYDVAHNSDDEEYMEFELFMSRREYKMIQKRMDRGKKQCVVEGNYMASYRPYGYDILKTKTSRTLIPNEEEAPIVKNCGKMMHYQRYTTKQNVQPRFTHKQSQICKVKSVLATDVMNAVVHALKLYIEDFNVKINNLPQTDENEIAKEIESLTTELMKIEKKLSKLFDAWEDEQISDNEFVKRKAVNNQRVENIKAEIEKLENSIPEKEEYEEKIMALSDALDSLLDENIDADIQNEYLKQIIDKIEFSRENNKEFILDVFLK